MLEPIAIFLASTTLISPFPVSNAPGGSSIVSAFREEQMRRGRTQLVRYATDTDWTCFDRCLSYDGL